MHTEINMSASIFMVLLSKPQYDPTKPLCGGSRPPPKPTSHHLIYIFSFSSWPKFVRQRVAEPFPPKHNTTRTRLQRVGAVYEVFWGEVVGITRHRSAEKKIMGQMGSNDTFLLESKSKEKKKKEKTKRFISVISINLQTDFCQRRQTERDRSLFALQCPWASGRLCLPDREQWRERCLQIFTDGSGPRN